jgi:transcriptional regulator NrdR family protein
MTERDNTMVENDNEMLENINEIIKNLEINSNEEIKSNEKSNEHVDHFEKLHDAYIRYIYILENVNFEQKTLFIKNNIEIFMEKFIEYKMDICLLTKFVDNIDHQIESYF